MNNNENFFETLRVAVPFDGKKDLSNRDYHERIARTMKISRGRVEAFKYGKTVSPDAREIARVQELIRGANDAAIRIRALANEVITRGEELKDEERKLWERVYRDLVNLRSLSSPQGVNCAR